MSRVVLLTGATGFVGHQVLLRLLNSECQIRLIVRSSDKLPTMPDGVKVSVIIAPDVFAMGVSWWQEVCRGVHTLIHVAWYAQPGDYLQSAKNLDCLAGTLFMAQGAAKAGIKRCIGVGTCFEYDLSDPVHDLTVETRLNPLTMYAASKVAAYHALSAWFKACDISFAWCRLFYLYGDGEHPRRLAPYVRAQLSSGQSALLTKGDQIRDFLDVRVAASQLVGVALGEQSGPVNICSGVPITVRQFVQKIACEFGRPDLLLFGVRPDNLTDPPRVVGVSNALLSADCLLTQSSNSK